jgi:hypothetical protein
MIKYKICKECQFEGGKHSQSCSQYKEVDLNVVCPFCKQPVKDLPSGLELKEMVKIAKEIIEKSKI